MDIQAVLGGAVSGDAKSNVNHPSVKAFLVALHLVTAIYLMIVRAIRGGLPATEIWLLFWTLFILQQLDLRKEHLGHFMRKAVWAAVIALVPVLAKDSGLVDPKEAFGWLKIMTAYVTLDDIVIFLFGIGAAIGANRLYSQDVMWISARLPRRARAHFIPTMITYFVVRRFLSESRKDIFRAAAFKMKLMKDQALVVRFTAYIGSIATQLIPRFSEIVNAVSTTLEERQIREDPRSRPIAPVSVTLEDYTAVIVSGAAVATAAILPFH